MPRRLPSRGAAAGSSLPHSPAPAIRTERAYGARNYDPLPVVLTDGEGAWVRDEHGRRYLDMMSAYSAVSHGHAHPRLVRALTEQAQRLAVTSRAFHNPRLPEFLRRLTEVTGLDRALPASGGAEAVETALKAARKWGHKVKHIPDGRAEIIVCDGNFHGRSITIVGFSSEPQYRDGFGPFPPGFVVDPLRRRGGARARDRPRTPRRSWSSRSRARAASSCRRRAGWPPARASAANATCCSSATRSRPAWAGRGAFSRPSTRACGRTA